MGGIMRRQASSPYRAGYIRALASRPTKLVRVVVPCDWYRLSGYLAGGLVSLAPMVALMNEWETSNR